MNDEKVIKLSVEALDKILEHVDLYYYEQDGPGASIVLKSIQAAIKEALKEITAKKVESQLAVAREALKAILPALEDEPEYHQQGMGCGLEDRSIHDRYDAMQYGWDCAIERFHEIFDGFPEIVREALAKMEKL